MIFPQLLLYRTKFRRIPFSGCLNGGPGNDVFNFGTITETGIPGPPGPPGPQGPQGPQGLPGNTSVNTTIITSTPYTALDSDYFIGVNIASSSVVNLPASSDGKVYIVKDVSGDANNNPITIQDIFSIDGSAFATINTVYGSLTFVFNGTEWSIV